MALATHGPLYAWIASSSSTEPSNELVQRALKAIRTHLGMDAAYVSEFIGSRAVLRQVDAPGLDHLIKVGDSYALDDIYLRHVIEGRLAQFVPDTSLEAVSAALPSMHGAQIGKHVSVPIRLPDGTVHGMFCCFGFGVDASLRERDVQVVKVLADIAAFAIARDLEAASAKEAKRDRIASAIEREEYAVVYQPIWKVSTQRLLGFEALARFSRPPMRSPDLWFAEAAEVGLRGALELAVARTALSRLNSFPLSMYISVNVSPELVLSGELTRDLRDLPAERIVLEITEHAQIKDYDRLREALGPLRDRGVRIAVDDAGAGYSSLQHILQLRPDLIKLDMSLTRNIDGDSARHALATALVGFAVSTGCSIIAEGVETASELKALRAIGVEKAQGYFLGGPMSVDAAAECALQAQANGPDRADAPSAAAG